MPERTNFLIGYGERLTSEVQLAPSGGPKNHPYTFGKARQRLTPKIQSTASTIASLPETVCPGDRSVALVTLHPTYLAKSYYPASLLRAYGLDTIGSRSREVRPEAWNRRRHPETALTSELYVAGPRQQFREFAREIGILQESDPGAPDLIKIEDFRIEPPAEKLKKLRPDVEEPLLEVVLHAQPTAEDAFVLDGFDAYLRTLGLSLNSDRRRFFAEGLCFLPLRVPREVAPEVVKFSFLRCAREMPRLRQFRPVPRAVPGFTPFACRLPEVDPVDRDVRVAIFDGGVQADGRLNRWVNRKITVNLAEPAQEYLNHGTAVTSALLFGPLQDGVTADRPYAPVDHYRVLDVNTEANDQEELYNVLERIRTVLETRTHYDFINLSIGPCLPIEDDDVHAWTAVLDQYFADGLTLPVIAVGNGGEEERLSGNARIQTPSDCVNGLAVGSCDRTGASWRRARYSSVGPGRSPGIMKPDGLAFGGSSHEPYWVLNAEDPGNARPITGTSFAAPTVLRTAIGLRAHFGTVLGPLAIKALLLHGCDDGGHDKAEVGWGRIQEDVTAIVTTDQHTAHIVYQGELRPASWTRMQIPVPAETMNGLVEIKATFCYASATDPQDPLNYTRSGLEVRFRPHDQKRKNLTQLHADSSHFFQFRDVAVDEFDLRADAHKWETTLHKSRSMRGANLRNPVFDVHYNARTGGHNSSVTDKMPYALVISVCSAQTTNVYNKIIQRYQTFLEPLTPVINIPIRT